MKGALYTLGAVELGDAAKDLELAAKEGGSVFCAEFYPGFEERLAVLAKKLGKFAKRQKISSRGPGSIPELVSELRKILAYAQSFDSVRASESISSLFAYSWEGFPLGETRFPIGETLERIADSLESIDYDEAERLITGLLGSLGERR
jgi:hypothetical protein